MVLAVIVSLAAHAGAAAQVVPGTYVATVERTVARFTVESPAGPVRATIPFQRARMEIAPDGAVTAARATLDAGGITGRSGVVEALLRRGGGLDVSRHPTIRFLGDGGIVTTGEMRLDGTLTLKGTTRPVTFSGEVVKVAERRFAAVLTTRIDRTMFGVTVGRPFYSRFADIRLRLIMVRPR